MAPVISGTILTVIKDGASATRIFMVYMMPPAMVALYFRTKMLLIFTPLLNATIILAYLYSTCGVARFEPIRKRIASPLSNNQLWNGSCLFPHQVGE